MFLNASDLQLRDFDFDLEFSPGELNFFEDQLVQETPLVAKGTASFRPSTREIFVKGFLTVVVSYPCDRCLERVRRSVRQEFELVYLPEDLGPIEEEREIGAAEADIGFYQGGGIELTDLLREQVLLELPMRRVCEPACASELASRAANPPLADARWKALEGFKAPRKGDSQ